MSTTNYNPRRYRNLDKADGMEFCAYEIQIGPESSVTSSYNDNDHDLYSTKQKGEKGGDNRRVNGHVFRNNTQAKDDSNDDDNHHIYHHSDYNHKNNKTSSHKKPWCQSNRCLIISVVVALLVVIGAGILIGVMGVGMDTTELSVDTAKAIATSDTVSDNSSLNGDNGDVQDEITSIHTNNSSNITSITATSSDGATTNEILDTLKKHLQLHGLEFRPNNFLSYQTRAAQWVVMTGLHGVGGGTHQPKRLLQRYALACIYFSSNRVSTNHPMMSAGSHRSSSGPTPRWIQENGWLEDDDECQWYGITCNNAVNNNNNETRFVTHIQLANNRLTGNLPPEIILLQDSLQVLDLYGNPIHHSSSSSSSNSGSTTSLVDKDGNVYDWLGDLTQLRQLVYGQTNFENHDDNGIPSSIGRLTQLVHYDCSHTLYRGPLQGRRFAPLSQLKYLHMGGNDYNSSIPNELAQLPNLQILHVDNAGLTGDLSFLVDMPAIVEVSLDDNTNMGGTIPTEIGLVDTLQSLSITNCSFTGTLPTELGQLNLINFSCQSNNVTRSVTSQHSGITWSCGG